MLERQYTVFDRSGIAALSDLETEEHRKLFFYLENEQKQFLEAQDNFRSKEYKWPLDPLHTWSRVWEYPYVYHHLKKWLSGYSNKAMAHVVDLGSGVTFFPFSIARLRTRVVCSDIDPICGKDIYNARRYIPSEPGGIDFRLIKDDLPFKDQEVDAVYCISVLEHIETYERTVSEIARILKPGGLLILTIDLDLRGDFAMGVVAHQRLTMQLKRYFRYLYPETTVHPSDILHSCSGPYALKKLQGLRLARFGIKQKLKPLLGKQPSNPPPYRLAVQTFVMCKN